MEKQREEEELVVTGKKRDQAEGNEIPHKRAKKDIQEEISAGDSSPPSSTSDAVDVGGDTHMLNTMRTKKADTLNRMMQVDIAEVFSPPRVCKNGGLIWNEGWGIHGPHHGMGFHYPGASTKGRGISRQDEALATHRESSLYNVSAVA